MEGNKVQNYKSCFDIIILDYGRSFFLHILLEQLRLVLLRDKDSAETPRSVDATIMSPLVETHKGHGTDFGDY